MVISITLVFNLNLIDMFLKLLLFVTIVLCLYSVLSLLVTHIKRKMFVTNLSKYCDKFAEYEGKNNLHLDQIISITRCQNTGARRSLVVLFGWLYAKDRHLEKYRKLYLNKVSIS